MLFKIIKNWLNIIKNNFRKNRQSFFTISKAIELNKQSKFREAIPLYKDYLKHNPVDAVAINDLGVCLANIGDMQEAHRLFELAYLLDDSHTPAIVNHAKFLADQKRGAESYAFLRKARALEPEFRHVDAIYASLCMNGQGSVSRARYFQLRAWTGNFDTLRYANSYLFFTSYDDIDESLLAAEHRFWADTLNIDESTDAHFSSRPLINRKIRIGYWSPDYREHSVRYFFRPLQENHDRNKFEIFVYHDSPFRDEQTNCIENASDSFHSVFELSDEDLSSLLLSHQLDILVELAGHTSNNRINLLKKRLSSLTITALGYPPTTGLNTINAKLIDKNIITSNYNEFYTENPLVLPSSFWCFDPMEDEPSSLSTEQPAIKNNYVTFACIGNIAKINDRILECWASILQRVPRSRILIRSINFDNPEAELILRERIEKFGIPLSRVDLRRAEGGKAFFESYNDIDIILDTYPFNGGTTTCFAVYMGVPVVTWAGFSLISRMGLSVMTNVGAADLVANDAESYIKIAVTLSQDIKYLQLFKRDSRQLMRNTGLGNGQIYAREFEQACVDMLSQNFSLTIEKKQQPNILPADEIVRRAYDVLNNGQTSTAKRILSYCFQHYPNCGSAHILYSNTIEGNNRFIEAIDYLSERLDSFSDEDAFGALINIVRNFLYAGLKEYAIEKVKILENITSSLISDKCQFRLYKKYLLPTLTKSICNKKISSCVGRLHFIIPCDDIARFEHMQQNIQKICMPVPGWKITFEHCKEKQRISAYQNSGIDTDIDILVFLQKNIDVCNPNLFSEIILNLRDCDMLGYLGATRWAKLDWITDDFIYKKGSFFSISNEQENFLETIVFGNSFKRIEEGIHILSGEFLAFKQNKFSIASLNKNLEGAEFMLEQTWTHDFFNAGGRLAVHQNLGLLRREDIALDKRYWGTVRLELSDAYNFELFEAKRPDLTFLNLPVPSFKDGLTALNNYFEE